jgi:predicted aldo/keto reductase-like oxidoreductase
VQYRTLGSLDWRPSALGFGAMRLPLLVSTRHGEPTDFSNVDREAATEMLHWAVDHGVNYVDTAYVYHDGVSEQWLGEALQGGYRERVMVATKLPVFKVAAPSDFDRYLDEQLARLRSPRIDFYLLHSLERTTWRKARDLGVLEWCQRAKADGRIGHVGFSFHDEYEVFTEIVDAGAGLWEFCQIQLNYMDGAYQAGLRGLRYAAQRGLGVIVMEPIRGGQLAKEPPPVVKALWASAPRHRTPAEWALQWVWNLPEVSLALSGMSTLEQVQQNVEYAERSGPGSLSDEELALIDRVRDAYRERMAVDCTGCRYCQPCPNGVDIPRILELYNDAFIYDDVERQRLQYAWLDKDKRAEACTQCGECETRCPQMLAVAEWLQRAGELLAPPGGAEEARPG